MEFGLISKKDAYMKFILLTCVLGSSSGQGYGDVRLAGGSTLYEGRVEIYYYGSWGTVCDDSWSIVDADVVCRQLGLGDAEDTRQFGRGTGRIWLDDVRCLGTESRLDSCSHRGWGVHNCDHYDDAGVRCSAGVFVFPLVIRIVIVIVIVIVIIGIISCFICCICACTRSGTRQRSGAAAMRTHQMIRVPAAIPSGVTSQTIEDPNPPASSLVMSSPPTMYAPSNAQINPAYPQQNNPQQP
ncbi:scavenger receptor cysteine-rich domain-containing protein DMBT1-like isoform X2 [Apostichopus japonicus]|uniref:scavenger receptor cysteine-rich domain-containing protein DMBT1-like isoform X2 n=1 Tax=Stichopus japonicus TaxID=307972 RepID=UPI003AB1D340